jgi:hypothetical protein
MAEDKPDVRKDVTLIMEGVLKGLLSIPFPDQFATPDGRPEYVTSHWCEKCKKYHRVYEA